jgi:hypothetical protein
VLSCDGESSVQQVKADLRWGKSLGLVGRWYALICMMQKDITCRGRVT